MGNTATFIFFLSSVSYLHQCTCYSRPFKIRDLLTLRKDVVSCTIVLVQPNFNHPSLSEAVKSVLETSQLSESTNLPTTLLWIISNFNISVFHFRSNLNASQYTIPKTLHRQRDVCKLIFSDLELYSPNLHFVFDKPVYYSWIISQWHTWIYQTSAGHIQPNSKNLIVFAMTVSENPSSISRNVGDTLLTAIHPTFILFMYRNTDIILHPLQTCRFCGIERITLYKISPFFQSTLNHLSKNFRSKDTKSIIFINFEFTAAFSITDINEKSLYFCNGKNIKRGFYSNINRTFPCDDPARILLQEASAKSNITIFFGTAFTSTTWTNFLKGVVHGTNIDFLGDFDKRHRTEYVMDTTKSTVFQYCERKLAYKINHIFEILGSPFSKSIWIVSLTSLVVLVLVKWKSRIKASMFGELLNMLEIVLQQSSQNCDKLSVVVLFCCFVMRFLYECDMTGQMISPPAVQLKSTLSELLTEGYKFAKSPILAKYNIHTDFIQALSAVATRLEFYTKREGFMESIHLPKFWSNEPLRAANESGIIYDWYWKHMYAKFRAAPVGCHYVPKAYAQIQQHFMLSGIFGNVLGEPLKRVMFDSGLRQYWVLLKYEFDIWESEKEGAILDKERVKILELDRRLYSLFCLTGGLFGVAIVLFVVENVNEMVLKWKSFVGLRFETIILRLRIRNIKLSFSLISNCLEGIIAMFGNVCKLFERV